jgi:hypothetical protein
MDDMSTNAEFQADSHRMVDDRPFRLRFVALAAWAAIIMAGQCAYWLIADDWIPISISQTASLKLVFPADGTFRLSVVTMQNSLAHAGVLMPWSAGENALNALVDFAPFAGSLFAIAAAMVFIGRTRRVNKVRAPKPRLNHRFKRPTHRISVLASSFAGTAVRLWGSSSVVCECAASWQRRRLKKRCLRSSSSH